MIIDASGGTSSADRADVIILLGRRFSFGDNKYDVSNKLAATKIIEGLDGRRCIIYRTSGTTG